MKIESLKEYISWLKTLNKKHRSQINKRIIKIEDLAYFGDCKYLNDDLAELRWKNGTRVYFSRIEKNLILMICGGNKNGQKKDIQKARLLLRRYADRQT